MTTKMHIRVNPYEGVPIIWAMISILGLAFVIALDLPFIGKVAGYVFFGLILLPTDLVSLSRTLAFTKGKWAKLHYPLMVRFAKVCGYIEGNPNASGGDFYVMAMRKRPKSEYASWLLLRSAVGNHVELTNELWSAACVRDKTFADKKMVKNYMLTKNPSTTKEQLAAVLKEAKETLVVDNPKMIIAELVAKWYGEAERDKYVIAVLTERAN